MSFDYDSITLFFIILFILIAIVLNLFIIISVIMNKKLRNFDNFLIFSIALADLFIDTVTIPLFLISFTVYFNKLLCLFWSISHFSFFNISFLSVIFVSANRIKNIKFPLFKIKYEKIIKYLLIFLVWLIPLISWSIVITMNNDDGYFLNQQCYFIYKFPFFFLVDIFAFIIPVIIFIILQFIIFYNMKAQEKIKSNEVSVIPKLVVINSFQAPPVESNITSKYNSMRNKRAFRILIITTMVHLLLWLPWITSWSFSLFLSIAGYEATYWILYLNSILNPIILMVNNRGFRLLLKLFLIKVFKFIKLY